MSWVDWLFAPRLTRGWQTRVKHPESSNHHLDIGGMVVLGFNSDNLFIWFGMTILISTPILSIGWYFLSLIAKNREVQLLTPKVRKP